MVSREAGSVTPQTTNRNPINSPVAKSSILQTQAAERKRLLDDYCASTKLLQVIQDFMTKLATTFETQFRLPANPYPELLNVMRMHELRQAFALQSNSSGASLELAKLSGQVQIPSPFQICSVEHEQLALPIWGTTSALEQLTGANLYGLLDQVNSFFRGLVLFKEFTDDDCRGSAYGVLVGESIFGYRLGNLPPSFLNLETHVFVSGTHLEKAMGVFARFLLKQLHEAANSAAAVVSHSPEEAAVYSGCVLCDGIIMTPQASSTTELTSQQAEANMWRIDRVMESRSAFITAVKTALVSKSFITFTRYELVKMSNGETFICQVEQAFFLHFATEDEAKLTDKGNVTLASRQSFMAGSRALTSGVFFDSKGALEVASRFMIVEQATLENEERKKQSQKKKKQTALVDSPSSAVILHVELRPRPSFIGIVQDTVNKLRRMELANDTFRQCVDNLVGCFAYNLGYLAQAHRVLVSVLFRPTIAFAKITMIQASFASLETMMNKFLEESNTVPPTSVLHPVCSLLRHFYRQAQLVSELKDDRQINEFVEGLRRIEELLLLVVRIVLSDFLHFVRDANSQAEQIASTISTEVQHEDCPAALAEVDVLRALEMAVEERKYPATIISEAVFAQAIIDSCLDVALESAVMNTVAVHLPPNPFIDMSMNLQVFALRQLVWKSDIQQTERPPIASGVSSRPELFSMEGTSLCAVNPKLLQLVESDRIFKTQQWLADRGVLYEGTYKPSKSSYSAAVFPTLLIFHPLLFAQSSMNGSDDSSHMKELDVVEHYLVEGKEIIQAQKFFLDAVRSDLRRVASNIPTGNNCWQIQSQLHGLDPLGQVAAVLDLSLSTTDEFINVLLEEVAKAQLILQLLIQIAEVKTAGDSSSLTIHRVTKIYAFHYCPTDDHNEAGPPAFLPPLLLFRISEYGIFFSRENALLYFKGIESVHSCEESNLSRNLWTPYASQAFQLGDTFLMYELDAVHKNGKSSGSLSVPARELINRLLARSDICQIYSLEQTIKWLLDALQMKIEQLMASKSRKEDNSTTVPPATLFIIHHRLALDIMTKIEKMIVPLNHQLQFLHKTSDLISMLRRSITRWQSIQPPTDATLELGLKQQEKAPGNIPLTPRDDPVIITNDLVDSLRATWILVLFFRFSYQRAFFSNNNI
ncbi:hypothetical protein ON010_g4345 [Phytophthora cinnamomi]|nr:hypothetical protein ON010_g4345 [Phytophthora cinnamomi]